MNVRLFFSFQSIVKTIDFLPLLKRKFLNILNIIFSKSAMSTPHAKRKPKIGHFQNKYKNYILKWIVKIDIKLLAK